MRIYCVGIDKDRRAPILSFEWSKHYILWRWRRGGAGSEQRVRQKITRKATYRFPSLNTLYRNRYNAIYSTLHHENSERAIRTKKQKCQKEVFGGKVLAALACGLFGRRRRLKQARQWLVGQKLKMMSPNARDAYVVEDT
jgi:hypothetical protein